MNIDILTALYDFSLDWASLLEYNLYFVFFRLLENLIFGNDFVEGSPLFLLVFLWLVFVVSLVQLVDSLIGFVVPLLVEIVRHAMLRVVVRVFLGVLTYFGPEVVGLEWTRDVRVAGLVLVQIVLGGDLLLDLVDVSGLRVFLDPLVDVDVLHLHIECVLEGLLRKAGVGRKTPFLLNRLQLELGSFISGK